MAYKGRRKARVSSKLYSLSRVAELISEVSGVTVEPDELRDLVNRNDAMELLDDLGKPRCLGTWMYWQRIGVGPRTVRLGTASRYVRADVVAWAQELSADPNKYIKFQRPDEQSADSGAVVGNAASPGDEGGGSTFSLSSSEG